MAQISREIYHNLKTMSKFFERGIGLKRSSRSSPQTAQLKDMFMSCSSFGDDDMEGQPEDVPRGHFTVYVGENRKRNIIPISWLSHPGFQCLLQLTEEEYGFQNGMGIVIPCKEAVFQSLAATIKQKREAY